VGAAFAVGGAPSTWIGLAGFGLATAPLTIVGGAALTATGGIVGFAAVGSSGTVELGDGSFVVLGATPLFAAVTSPGVDALGDAVVEAITVRRSPGDSVASVREKSACTHPIPPDRASAVVPIAKTAAIGINVRAYFFPHTRGARERRLAITRASVSSASGLTPV
jgi:hypothetical protein